MSNNDPYPIRLAKAGAFIAVANGLVPTFRLTQAAAVGATQLYVDNPANLRPYMPIGCYEDFLPEGQIEPKVVVDPDWVQGTNPVLISTVGRSWSGLKFAHPVGSLWASNLFRTPLNDATSSLKNGYPIVASYCLDNTESGHANKQFERKSTLSFAYWLPATQNDGPNAMDPQLWVESQLDRAETDIQTLIDAVVAEPRLSVYSPSAGGYVSNALLLLMTKTSRRPFFADASRPRFEFYLDLVVYGLFHDL